MKTTSLLLHSAAILVSVLMLFGCKDPAPSASAPVLVSTEPADGVTELEGTSLTVQFNFDSAVVIPEKNKAMITAGEATVSEVLVLARYVSITVTGLQQGKTYTISIPTGCICSKDAPDLYAKAISYTFTMKGRVTPDTDEWESAADAVANMKVGWNLGNTLDSNSGAVDNMWIEGWKTATVADYETAWGQPQATRELIHMFKEAGFNAIRVPVTWYPHMGKLKVNIIDGKPTWDKAAWTGYEVDPVWMARVKEVVDYVIDEGLYCILNVHHDTGDATTAWLRADSASYSKYSERFKNLWNQIATQFADYGDHLVFESFNEMLDEYNSWNTSRSEGFLYINKYNSDFVQTVRATGGNNAYRNLVLNTYAASVDPAALKAFAIPDDSVSGHLIAEVHSYAPYQFAFDMANPADQWTEFNDYCDSQVRGIVDAVHYELAKKSIPIIIGEYGATSKLAEEEMAKQAACYVSQAKKHGITCFYWMALSDGEDRSVPKWSKTKLKNAIINAYYN